MLAGATVVLFDLDDTLIVEADAVTEALLAAGRRVADGRRVDPADFAASVRRRAREHWRAFEHWPWCHALGISSWEALCGRFEGEDAHLAALRQFLPEFRRRTWCGALDEHDVRDADLPRALAETFVHEQASRRTPFADAVSTLDRLRAGRRLGLVTNGASDLQREKLRRAGLERWFDVVTVSGDVGVGKPDPRPFLRTLEALGASPADAVMVGDNLDRDVAGARAAGIRSVWIDRRRRVAPSSVRPDARIERLADLLALLDR